MLPTTLGRLFAAISLIYWMHINRRAPKSFYLEISTSNLERTQRVWDIWLPNCPPWRIWWRIGTHQTTCNICLQHKLSRVCTGKSSSWLSIDQSWIWVVQQCTLAFRSQRILLWFCYISLIQESNTRPRDAKQANAQSHESDSSYDVVVSWPKIWVFDGSQYFRTHGKIDISRRPSSICRAHWQRCPGGQFGSRSNSSIIPRSCMVSGIGTSKASP